MTVVNPNKINDIIAEMIPSNGFFPNNQRFPFIVFKQVINVEEHSTQSIEALLANNSWGNSWVDGIYDYHHYHSNTHEVLVVYDGNCEVMIGGPDGNLFQLSKGDVVIIPAGVAHKKERASDNFTTIGAYPLAGNYNMCYGTVDEHPKVDQEIENVELPKTDPVFGKCGYLFEYWK